MIPTIKWPGGKSFAFTIFDDTDLSTVANTQAIYSFLYDLGLLTTKSVWPTRGRDIPRIGGATCEDHDYLAWVESLQARGFEIGYHCATYHSSRRNETARGLDRFKGLFGQYPSTMANHTGCQESIYWGSARLQGANRLIYNLLTRYRHHQRYLGHVQQSEFFWGDLCRERVRYVRNFVYADINTLRNCPIMPYHDPERPFVNYWFASSEGPNCDAFNKCISEKNQDRLESEGGACIMYTHLACGFQEQDGLNKRFRSLMERLSKMNGWFIPVERLLDYLLEAHNYHEITFLQRARIERRWLRDKMIVGPS